MLKTRLDGRSEENSLFEVKDQEGNVLATIKLCDGKGATLEVSTQKGLYIEKPSGWNSKRN